MAKLRDRVQNALDETRMLVLGAEVLLGFQYRSAFESGFEQIPPLSRYMSMAALASLLAVVVLLVSPGAYHQIVEEGHDSRRLHDFTTTMMDVALLPFAASLAISIFVMTERLTGRSIGMAFGIASLVVALFFWYGLEAIEKRNRAADDRGKYKVPDKDDGTPTRLKDKIKQVLTEARVVIPGAQALLGFQLTIILMEGFDKVPMSSKYVHMASLAFIALSIVLLMTLAAYHRIVENGQDSERFHAFAARILLAAMAPLAIGIAGDVFVVFRKITASLPFALICSTVTLLCFIGFWFLLPAYVKRSHS
ncbi:MAG TPA: DUF6328 family protein [Blastocatellia bacterium]|nr:DUF6328 family protein [Blastocatellia bacterium]